MAFNSAYKLPGGVVPTASTAASAVDALVYIVRSTTGPVLDCVYLKAFG